MDFSLTKCSTHPLGQTTRNLRLRKCSTDRLGSLPVELISHILSSLPTKDAAVASLSSRKMRSAFTLLTTLNFDDSPISYCARKHPQLTDRFQFFKTFVDNILRTSQSSQLSSFRLRFGGNYLIKALHHHHSSSICGAGCFPDLESTQLNAWIGFPLSCCGIREIDLCIHVRNPGKLPWALFACETLEVLKLDTNLDFDLVSMPSLKLPNLKVLQLRSIFIPADDFVSRLVSNYPLLEDLHVDCYWNWKYGNFVTISSPSLQNLVLHMNKEDEYGEFFKIDTPNLKYLLYNDLLAHNYTVASMKALVKASLDVSTVWDEEYFHSTLCLVKAVSNAQHLRLMLSCVKTLDHKDLKIHLPVFHNLIHLELGHDGLNRKWDTVLLEFLKCTPLLETLEFPMGLVSTNNEHDLDEIEVLETERSSFRTNQVNPCCKDYLKRIIIKECWGSNREVEIFRFLLQIAPMLEEFFVTCKAKVDQSSLLSMLNGIPRTSSSCVIIVQYEANNSGFYRDEDELSSFFNDISPPLI